MKKISVPTVTRAQMAEIDRLMIENYGITILQMMENAGKSLAELSRSLLSGDLGKASILVVCGGGNNGGGGMAAARHLHNWGAVVTVAQAVDFQSLKDAPKHQLRILEKMGVNIERELPDRKFDLIIDALVGYGLRGSPEGIYAQWIEWINHQASQKIALDIPSGLDADTGYAPGECISADATFTLALPKIGLTKENAKKFAGDLYLADISVPLSIINRFKKNAQYLFSKNAILKL